MLTIKTGETAERMTLRDYLVGVVRGEMPASFEMEALKAQAAAERTYVYYQLAQGRKAAHPAADFCTDHTCCSAYLSETAAKEKWAADFAPWNPLRCMSITIWANNFSANIFEIITTCFVNSGLNAFFIS